MMKKIPPNLKKIIFHDKRKRGFLCSFVVILNTIASLFEGASFACVFLALSTLNGDKIGGVISWFPSFLTSALSTLSQNRLFTVFLLGAVFLQVFRSALSYCAQFLMTYWGAKVQAIIQEGIYDRIFRLSYRCVSNYKIGDLEDYTKAPTMFVTPFFDSINRLLVSLLISTVILILMFFLSVKLSFFVLGLIGAVAISQSFIIKRVAINSQRQTESIVEQAKQSVQSLYGLKAVYSFNRQKQILKSLSVTIKNTALSTVKLYIWNHLILPVNEIAGVLLVGATLIMGVFLLESGHLPLLATLVTFLTLTYRLAFRLHAMMAEFGGLARYYGSFLRCVEIWKDEDKEFRSQGGEKCPPFCGQITFDNASLTYLPKSDPALENISCVIPRGKTTAFVGASGAGKSSLIDLIVRLYEPTQGKVCIDGKELATYSLDSWLERLGVVCQDTIIFNESVEDNIRFGLMDTSQKEIEKAATIAGAHEFILSLPQGYQTVVGEKGFRLSGGERQRLALARALLRDPEILILDEATSNLDSLSESLIQQALNNLHGQKTIVIVAHRLSTVKEADKIIVLDKGQIIEQGTHQELLDMQGKYHHFWNLQSETAISSILDKKMQHAPKEASTESAR